MTRPNKTEINAAYEHAVWLRCQECTGEGRMLADLSWEIDDLSEKLAAVQDLNRRLLSRESP